MTAVEELKKYFEQQLRIHLSNKIKYTTEEALLDAIEICKNCINTKEKQQIIDFANDFIEKHTFGDYDGQVQKNKTVEEYYNETFKNK